MAIKNIPAFKSLDRKDDNERKKIHEDEVIDIKPESSDDEDNQDELIKLSDYRLIFAPNSDISHYYKEKSEFNAIVLIRQPAVKPKSAVVAVVPFVARIYREGIELNNSNTTITLDNIPNDHFVKEYIKPETQKFGEIQKPTEKDKKLMNSYIRTLALIDLRATAAKRHFWGKVGVAGGLTTAGGILATIFLVPPSMISNGIALFAGGVGGLSSGAWFGRKYHQTGSIRNALCCIPEKFPKISSYDLYIKSKWDPDKLDAPLGNDFNAFILVKKQKRSKTGALVYDVYDVFIYKNGKETKNSRASISLNDIKSVWSKKFINDESLRDRSGSGHVTKPSARAPMTEYTQLLTLINARAEPISRAKYERLGRYIGAGITGTLVGLNFATTSGVMPIILGVMAGTFEGINKGYLLGGACFNAGGVRGLLGSCAENTVSCLKAIKNNVKNCVSGCATGIVSIASSCCTKICNSTSSCCRWIKNAICCTRPTPVQPIAPVRRTIASETPQSSRRSSTIHNANIRTSQSIAMPNATVVIDIQPPLMLSEQGNGLGLTTGVQVSAGERKKHLEERATRSNEKHRKVRVKFDAPNKKVVKNPRVSVASNGSNASNSQKSSGSNRSGSTPTQKARAMSP